MLAAASSGMVVGFNVRPNAETRAVAEREGVEIRTYDVIYKLTEDIEQALVGMLATVKTEETIGEAEVRETFRASRIGTIAGCMVTNGVIRRDAQVRVIRDGTVDLHDDDRLAQALPGRRARGPGGLRVRPPSRRTSTTSRSATCSRSSRRARSSARRSTSWVPPIQRSTPSSSTRSASPRSTRSPPPSAGAGAARSAGRRRAAAAAEAVCRRPSRRAASPRPERRERAEEPGVAEERRLLEPLRGDERRGRRARARGDRLERAPLGPREPVAGAGSSSSSRRSAGARNGSSAVPRVAHSASAVGSGARKASQALAAAVERVRCRLARGRARASPARSPSARPARRTPACPGNEPTTISSGAAPVPCASASASSSWSWS